MANYSKKQIKELIVKEAIRRGINPAFVLAIAEHESGFDPNAKNFSRAERSYGLFQINTNAHPGYKGGFDINKNIQYGVGVAVDALKKAKGDYFKAAAIYNGGLGGQQASIRNGYPKAIISLMNRNRGSIESTNNSVSNRRTNNTMASNTNNRPALQGQVSQAAIPTEAQQMSMINRLLEANAAAGNRAIQKVQMPNTVNQQYYIQNMVDNNFDLESVRRAALAGVDFASLEASLGYNANNPAPWTASLVQVLGGGSTGGLRPKTTLSRAEQINKQYQDIAEQNYINQINMLNQVYNPQAQAQRESSMRQLLQDRYNQFYNQVDDMVAQDPRLQNTGYYINPRDVESNIAGRVGFALAGGDPNLLPTAQQIAQARYEAQVANQYGVPYQQAMDARQQGYNIKLALFENQINQQLAADLSNAQTQQAAQRAYLDAEQARANARKAAYAAQLAEEDAQRTNRQQLMNTQLAPMQQGVNTLANTGLTTSSDLVRDYLGNINEAQIEANKLRSAEDIARMQAATELEKQTRQYEDPTYQMGGQAKYISSMAEAAGWNPTMYAQNIQQSRYNNLIYPTGEVVLNPNVGNNASNVNQGGGLRIPQVNFNLGVNRE